MRIVTVTIVIQKCGPKCPWWSTENIIDECKRHNRETHAAEWIGPFPEFCDLEQCEHYVIETEQDPKQDRASTKEVRKVEG
jgi:hypothetical protein